MYSIHIFVDLRQSEAEVGEIVCLEVLTPNFLVATSQEAQVEGCDFQLKTSEEILRGYGQYAVLFGSLLSRNVLLDNATVLIAQNDQLPTKL